MSCRGGRFKRRLTTTENQIQDYEASDDSIEVRGFSGEKVRSSEWVVQNLFELVNCILKHHSPTMQPSVTLGPEVQQACIETLRDSFLHALCPT